MSSYNVVVPTKIHRVSVRRRIMPGAATEGEIVEELLYDGGFAAGYQAGQWKAQQEADEAKAIQAADVEAVLKGLQCIQTELLNQARQNLPALLMGALERVFKNHPVTEEEVTREIAALLQDVTQAQSICIECFPEELDHLQMAVEKLGLMLQKGVHSWKSNPTLKRGEFILQTDLGTIDGRKISKLSKVKAALKME